MIMLITDEGIAGRGLRALKPNPVSQTTTDLLCLHQLHGLLMVKNRSHEMRTNYFIMNEILTLTKNRKFTTVTCLRSLSLLLLLPVTYIYLFSFTSPNAMLKWKWKHLFVFFSVSIQLTFFIHEILSWALFSDTPFHVLRFSRLFVSCCFVLFWVWNKRN